MDPPPPWVGGGWLGEFTVCTVCIEKQKTTKKWPNGDGPSENERKSELKEITKVTSTFFWWGCK